MVNHSARWHVSSRRCICKHVILCAYRYYHIARNHRTNDAEPRQAGKNSLFEQLPHTSGYRLEPATINTRNVIHLESTPVAFCFRILFVIQFWWSVCMWMLWMRLESNFSVYPKREVVSALSVNRFECYVWIKPCAPTQILALACLSDIMLAVMEPMDGSGDSIILIWAWHENGNIINIFITLNLLLYSGPR